MSLFDGLPDFVSVPQAEKLFGSFVAAIREQQAPNGVILAAATALVTKLLVNAEMSGDAKEMAWLFNQITAVTSEHHRQKLATPRVLQ